MNTYTCVQKIWGPLSLSLRISVLRLLVFIGRAGWGESENKEDKEYGGMHWNWDHVHMEK